MEQAAQQPGLLAHPSGVTSCTFLCLLHPVYPVCKMMLGITALPPDEEQMLQESGSQI